MWPSISLPGTLYIIIVLLGCVVALPSSLNGCDQPMTVDFADLNETAGVPALLNPPIPNPYHGLDYGLGWGPGVFGTPATPGKAYILFYAQTLVRGPADITADANAKVAAYALKSFDWAATTNTAQGAAVIGVNATLLLRGTLPGASAPTVSATCNYTVPLGTVGVPVGPGVPTQTCTLPGTFSAVKRVDFSAQGLLAPATTVVLERLRYVLHKTSC